MKNEEKDQSKTIQEELDAALEAGGGIVWIPKGIYRFKPGGGIERVSDLPSPEEREK